MYRLQAVKSNSRGIRTRRSTTCPKYRREQSTIRRNCLVVVPCLLRLIRANLDINNALAPRGQIIIARRVSVFFSFYVRIGDLSRNRRPTYTDRSANSAALATILYNFAVIRVPNPSELTGHCYSRVITT